MKRLGTATVIVVFISLAAIGIATLLFFLVPQSAEIVRLMQWRMIRARGLGFDVRVDYEGVTRRRNEFGVVKETPEAFRFATQGQLDRRDPANPKLGQEFTLALGTASPLEFAGELRSYDSEHYLRFSRTPERVGPLSFSGLTDLWTKFTLRAIREKLDAPYIGGAMELAETDRQELLAQARSIPFLDFEGKLQDEDVGGVPTHHYGVTPELLYVKDFLNGMEARRLGRPLTEKERETIDRFFGNLTAEAGEFWIGQNDYYLYRARLRFRYDDGVRFGTVTVEGNFRDFNAPVEVAAAPAEAKDATLVLESLLPSIKAHLPLAREGQVSRGLIEEPAELPAAERPVKKDDADEDGLDAAFEFFYGTDPANADTDGDGVSDGDEVQQGRNPTGPGGLFDFGLGSQR